MYSGDSCVKHHLPFVHVIYQFPSFLPSFLGNSRYGPLNGFYNKCLTTSNLKNSSIPHKTFKTLALFYHAVLETLQCPRSPSLTL